MLVYGKEVRVNNRYIFLVWSTFILLAASFLVIFDTKSDKQKEGDAAKKVAEEATQKRARLLSEVDQATATLYGGEPSLLEEARGEGMCALYNQAEDYQSALGKIAVINPPPSLEEEKRYHFSREVIEEEEKEVNKNLSHRFYEKVKKRQPIGGCMVVGSSGDKKYLEEIEFFEELSNRLYWWEVAATKEEAAKNVRAAFLTVLRRHVKGVKELARLEYIANKSGDEAFMRTRLTELSDKAGKWHFSDKEVGIELHLLTLTDTKPVG